MLEEFKKIDDFGVSSMLCAKISDKILIYGGSNFPNEKPPHGKRVVYNDMKLYDKDFNLLSSKKGLIYPDKGLTIEYKDRVYYIAGVNNKSILEYRLENDEVIETKICDLEEEMIGVFGALAFDKIYFGLNYMYEFDIEKRSLKKLNAIPFSKREQAICASYKNYIYIFGGASNICHLDVYKYDILENSFTKLLDSKFSLTAAATYNLGDRLLITGGLNKEKYDEALANFSSMEYKEKYFKEKRENFKWNKKVLTFSFLDETFSTCFEDENAATCGSALIRIGNAMYLVNGEVKPGYRTPYVYKFSLNV